MTARQPALHGHGATVRTDEEAPVTEDHAARPDVDRARLARSMSFPAPLREVCEAIAVASAQHLDFRVVRRDGGWCWAFAHRGGPYALLRVTARFLQMDHTALIVPVGRAERGYGAVVTKAAREAVAWATVGTLSGPATMIEVGRAIHAVAPAARRAAAIDAAVRSGTRRTVPRARGPRDRGAVRHRRVGRAPDA